MIHNQDAKVIADNGQQVFLACDIEPILDMAYDYTYENGRRERRYMDYEICDYYHISRGELDRMKYLLSYDYNHDANGNYRF